MSYVDLQVTTNYSFLRGASFPREMVAAAAALGHETVAIADRNTLAGIVKAYDAAKQAGATGGKISGAGGGGFMIFYCPGNTRYTVMEQLRQFGGKIRDYSFTQHGLFTWTS